MTDEKVSATTGPKTEAKGLEGQRWTWWARPRGHWLRSEALQEGHPQMGAGQGWGTMCVRGQRACEGSRPRGVMLVRGRRKCRSRAGPVKANQTDAKFSCENRPAAWRGVRAFPGEPAALRALLRRAGLGKGRPPDCARTARK